MIIIRIWRTAAAADHHPRHKLAPGDRRLGVGVNGALQPDALPSPADSHYRLGSFEEARLKGDLHLDLRPAAAHAVGHLTGDHRAVKLPTDASKDEARSSVAAGAHVALRSQRNSISAPLEGHSGGIARGDALQRQVVALADVATAVFRAAARRADSQLHFRRVANLQLDGRKARSLQGGILRAAGDPLAVQRPTGHHGPLEGGVPALSVAQLGGGVGDAVGDGVSGAVHPG